jgi:hypothetical protein
MDNWAVKPNFVLSRRAAARAKSARNAEAQFPTVAHAHSWRSPFQRSGWQLSGDLVTEPCRIDSLRVE